MSDFDDAIGEMTEDLLAEAGGSFVYIRGNQSTTITLRKSAQPVYQVDSGNGSVIEVRPVDFIGKTSSLPYAIPLRGDRITGGGKTFEVQPTVSEKCFFQKSDQMTRIHTKQVN